MPSFENPLRKLNASGQSVWCDHIHRTMLTTGGLAGMVEDDDLRGITSNPAIFDKGITSGHEYDEILERELRRDPNQSPRDLFFALAIEDIRDAADVMLPVYQATGGVDGMVSLEVSPDLAHDTEATLREARALHARLSRPNIMIKVPGTKAGLPAIEQLTAEGININVTLLFSVERYQEVAEAYLRGLERRRTQAQPIDRIASVASSSSAGSTPLSTRCWWTGSRIFRARSPSPTPSSPIDGSKKSTAARGSSPCARPGPIPSACCGPAPAPRTQPIPSCFTASS